MYVGRQDFIGRRKELRIGCSCWSRLGIGCLLGMFAQDGRGLGLRDVITKNLVLNYQLGYYFPL